MALIDNVVHEQSTTTGSGNMTIGALNGRQRFSSAFATGGSDTFYYSILNQSAQEWEIGTGSLSDANTLVRDTVLASSNSGSAVNFSAGTKDVLNGIPTSDAMLKTDLGTGVATWLATPSSSNLAAAVTGETGSGALVFGTSPTISGPTLTGTVALSSGGVLSWNSGAVTLTHSTNKLTFAGASSGYAFSDGNVGIGTSSPSQRLHLFASNASPDGIVISNTGGGSSRFWINNTTEGTDSQVLLRSTSGGSPLYWSMAIDGSDSHKFKIDNNVTAGGTTRVTIDSSGNVGIGTTSPSTTLHVNGPVRTASYTVATLPAAGTVGAGTRAYVTDASATTFASTVAGGGANAVPVYSDGTNWKIG